MDLTKIGQAFQSTSDMVRDSRMRAGAVTPAEAKAISSFVEANNLTEKLERMSAGEKDAIVMASRERQRGDFWKTIAVGAGVVVGITLLTKVMR